MGFSSALQGRAAHEALIVRQDAELRLMETMKRSIQAIAKCDKEYAIGLAAAAQQGLKIDRADDLQDSLITKSWRSYMDELDHQAKQFKTNAELLEVVCEKLAHLSQDKRKARKAYQEEHARIAARLNHLTDEVVRKKAEYQKHLEGYKALRTRFEEYYIKAGRGGRKLDDVRDKYQKACRKLHLTHNEYVLSITEAIEVEKDFRTVLLPGLLEHQQSVQESFILLWKNILQEATQHSDLTSDKFMEIQRRINTAMNSINPSEEYREFTERHKTLPATPFNFQFDDSLIEDVPGKLHSNTLTVDNLTVDWLRTRLLELELSVKECQEKQFKMIEHVNGGSPITNGSILTNGNNTNLHTNKDNRQSKDLNALRCQEKQKQKLVDMIKCALNEVGCEELPSGCDDHLSLEQSFIENSFDQTQQSTTNTPTVSGSVSIINELRRRGGVLTLWRGRPFKRKSTPQPTTPTMRTDIAVGLKHKLQPRSQSLGSLSVKTNSNQLAKYEPITNPLRMAASVEANHCYGLHVDTEFDDIGTVIVFGKSKDKDKPLPRLRRTQISMLCLDEETVLTNHHHSHHDHHLHQQQQQAVTHTNNNNNIYADLEINCKNNQTLGDSESLKSDEVAEHGLTQVEIEINVLEKKESPTEVQIENSIFELDAQAMPPINSIDRYLDKIDTLNRVLDDRFKRQLPSLPSRELDSLDTIEIADNSEIVKRAKDENSASSKRTSSSSSDSRFKELTNQIAAHGKKRSLSFSQKSINAIFTNIKEFSKSPLSRIHKSHSHPLTENSLEHKQGFILEESIVAEQQDLKAIDSKCSENTNESGIATDSEALTNSSTQVKEISTIPSNSNNNSNKNKFKVPKIQKKSKAIRNTFRNKIMNFQMKRGKYCKICSKRRRIHPSKSMFDFTRDINSIESSTDEFCSCPNELITTPKRQRRALMKRTKMVTTATNTERCVESTTSSLDADEDELGSDDTDEFKDHCYCVPSLSTSVSSIYS